MRTPTTTGHVLLGLLALRSWTAYELTQQMRRAVRWAWPRSEANLYNEIKRLADAGLAVAIEEESGGRSRTRYEITDAGREAVTAWLGQQPPSEPKMELEVLLRTFLADLGSADDLRASLAATRSWCLDVAADAATVLEDYVGEHPPFPERAHLNAAYAHLLAGHVRNLMAWCDDVEAELDAWAGATAGVGPTAGSQRMFADAVAFYRGVLSEHGHDEGAT
ncbi:PadR family transcriptional regulator [Actinomarinicola tropica]|uniref:PadR family transcriptional regulator n=1 Tax=Actinomarinicola tropica TaxID=2789776 RepID=A0A5Q2RBL0_9ACTN|nr:PadR family transcriptional regulator [Actinomarinicola tropica]QGG94259.1 PadR family transcriptional regulator [Actinomarinicola tropica]